MVWAGHELYRFIYRRGVTIYLFAGSFLYSQYVYADPTLDMKLDAFIRAHVHMYEFHDRVPTGTICDNLKTGVVSHPKEGGLNNTLAIIKALSYRAPPVRVKPASRVH